MDYIITGSVNELIIETIVTEYEINDFVTFNNYLVETNEKYYYEHPVLLDVSQLHTIDNCESIVEDRVTLQLFLTADYEKCERIINENRTY